MAPIIEDDFKIARVEVSTGPLLAAAVFVFGGLDKALEIDPITGLGVIELRYHPILGTVHRDVAGAGLLFALRIGPLVFDSEAHVGVRALGIFSGFDLNQAALRVEIKMVNHRLVPSVGSFRWDWQSVDR